MEDVGENIDENSEDQQVNDEDNNIKNDCVYLFDEDYPEYEKNTKEKGSWMGRDVITGQRQTARSRLAQCLMRQSVAIRVARACRLSSLVQASATGIQSI